MAERRNVLSIRERTTTAAFLQSLGFFRIAS
jgi:hypothetical protein